MTATAISWEGDEIDRASLRELARRRSTSVAKLVKEAVDITYGNELQEIKPLFVAVNGSRKNRKGRSQTGEKRVK